MLELPDPDWYLDNVLVHVEPGWSGPVRPGPAALWRAWWSGLDQSTAASRLAAMHGFVLPARDLAAAGVSRQRARTLTRHGGWTDCGYGCVAPVDVRDPSAHVEARRRHALMCGAATLRRPGHVVSGRSAAVLDGLPTFELPDRPELTDPASVGLGRRGPGHVHGAGLTPHETTTWFGVAVTTVARTLVDLGRHDRRDAIMAADAALREQLTTPHAITAALDGARGWPGVRQARKVLALASPLAESPLESLTRLVLHDDGFPDPELQVVIPGTAYRVDMLWPRLRLILEIDGLDKYTVEEVRREKRREIRLRRLGYRVERVIWDDIVADWPGTRVWLRAALRLPADAG